MGRLGAVTGGAAAVAVKSGLGQTATTPDGFALVALGAAMLGWRTYAKVFSLLAPVELEQVTDDVGGFMAFSEGWGAHNGGGVVRGGIRGGENFCGYFLNVL